MNKEYILELADFLETIQPGAEIGFNMRWFVSKNSDDYSGYKCGTVACIAGWIALRDGHEYTPGGYIIYGAEKLGIAAYQAVSLFAPSVIWDNAITPQQAAIVLRHFANTGEVDWDVVFPDQPVV